MKNEFSIPEKLPGILQAVLIFEMPLLNEIL